MKEGNHCENEGAYIFHWMIWRMGATSWRILSCFSSAYNGCLKAGILVSDELGTVEGEKLA